MIKNGWQVPPVTKGMKIKSVTYNGKRRNEKRFTYDKPLVAFSKGGINDNVTGETYEFTMDTVLELLNSLAEENERKTNEIKLLRKQYSKIPKNIREVWK